VATEPFISYVRELREDEDLRFLMDWQLPVAKDAASVAVAGHGPAVHGRRARREFRMGFAVLPFRVIDMVVAMRADDSA